MATARPVDVRSGRVICDSFTFRPLRRRVVCVVLALVTGLGPMISMAAAVHDLEHLGQDPAHLAADVPHSHLDATAKQAATPADDGTDAGDAFHRLAHAGHCCAQGAAITSHLPELAGTLTACEAPHSSIIESRPSPPVRLFRPPIAI